MAAEQAAAEELKRLEEEAIRIEEERIASEKAAAEAWANRPLPPFSNYNKPEIEWVLWLTYLSSAFYLLGLVVMFPIGFGFYDLWLPIEVFL